MASSRAFQRTCARCGKIVRGQGPLCARCAAGAAPAAAPVTDVFLCPYCRRELTWETLRSTEAEVSIYVREKIYSCPGCRCFLGVASWHTEG
ncbi:MAG: hypothetical protein ACK44W_11405 [Planctomycetota bacterium]